MQKFTRLLLLIFLATITQNSWGQPLNGTYSVGTTFTGSETDHYTTLAAAITDLNTKGVGGPCIFYFTDNGVTYSQTNDLAIGYTGGSATNTVTFKPYTGVTCTISFSNNVTRTIDGSLVIGAADAAAALPGSLISTNYLTIDGSNTSGGTTRDLTIQNTGITIQKSLIRIFGNNDNITIKNCVLNSSSNSANTTAGVYITNYYNTSVNYTPDNLLLENNAVTNISGNGASGFYFNNSGTPTVCNTAIQIKNNSISARATRALYFNYVNDATVSNNSISLDNQLGTGAAAGIYLTTGLSLSGTFNINGNVFTKLATLNATSGPSNGIIGIDNTLASSKIVNIYNNVIRGFQTTSGVSNSKIYGIRHSGSSTCNIYNNSIYLPDLTNMTTFGTSYISGVTFASTAEGNNTTGILNCKNNAIFMDEPTMKVYAFRFGGSGGGLNCDNNILFINSSNSSGFIGSYATIDKQLITDWQTASGQDANSFNTNPNYTSSTNLLPTLGYPGTVLPSVTTDITGATRIQPPTIGAYEASPLAGSWKTSAGSNDWDVATNWVGDVLPTATSTVIIPSSSSPMPTISTATNNTIRSLQNYGTLTIAGSVNINLTSDLTNYGTVSAPTGGFVFAGLAAQTAYLNTGSVMNLGGVVVNNNYTPAPSFKINGSGKINIYGALGFGNVNNSSIDVGNSLTFKSTIAGTGQLTDITNAGANSGNSVTGTFTQERYIPAKAARKWSFVASPVSQSISNGWQQTIHITGTTAGTAGTPCPSLTQHDNGFDATATNVPSMLYYDAALASGSRWASVSTTNATNLTPGSGYRLNVRGPRSAGCALLDGTSLIPTEATLSATGAFTNGTNYGGCTYNYNGVDAMSSDPNYILIGNPYPSPLKFSQLYSANSGTIENKYAIYSPLNPSGSYAYWDGSGATFTGGTLGLFDAKGDSIASGQAIFVKKSTTGNITLNFGETMKAAGPFNGVFRKTTFNEMLRIGYYSANNKLDEIIVRFSNDKRVDNTKETDLDIASINYGTNFLTSLKANKGMAIQTRILDNIDNDKVALNVVSTISGTYKLSFTDYANFNAAEILLIDNFTKAQVNIKQNPEYTFTVDKNNAATQGNGRFELLFKKIITPVLVTNNVLKIYPNPASKELNITLPNATESYTIKVMDITGKLMLQQNITTFGKLNISTLAKGNYVVEVSNENGYRVTEKIVKQ